MNTIMERIDEKHSPLSRLNGVVWSERTLNLIDLLKETGLPTVVKMHTDDSAGNQPARKDPVAQTPRREAGALLHKPLLLYKETKGIKLMARNISSLVAVKTSKNSVQYRESETTVVLPVDYPGWFRILDEDTVPIISVSNLARLMPVSFLSVRKLPGFTLLDPLNRKDIMYEKLDFPAGVYYVQNVYEDYVKYLGERNDIKRKLLRCLVCATEEGLDFLVPFDVPGEFYIMENRKQPSRNTKGDKNSCAYSLKQLVTMGVFTKPLTLKLLVGDPPSKPCGFTGVIRVFDIIKDWTVISSTLDGSRKLMELPVLPFPEFRLSTNGKDLLETGSLRPDLMFMSGGAADKYAKEIKVRARLTIQAKDIPQQSEAAEPEEVPEEQT